MPNFKNIAISGEIGTGTTTLAKSLSEQLGWQYINTGDFFRDWHREHRVPLDETKQIPPELDRQIDMGFRKKMVEEVEIVFEARLAGWLGFDAKANHTLRVLLKCDEEVALRRALARDGGKENEIMQKLKKRSKDLKGKFRQLYGIEDYLDPKYFNLIVDTTNLNPQEVLQTVLKSLGKA